MMTTIIDRKPQIDVITSNKAAKENANKQHIVVIASDTAWTEPLPMRLNPYYRLESCATGREAICYMHKAQLQNQQVDLILLDNILPDMPALELLSIIKRDLHLKHLPVILIHDPESKITLRKAAVKPDLYLEKPCSGHEMLGAIASILDWPISQAY